MREAVDELDQEALRELLRGIIDIPNGRTLLGESMGGSGRSSPIEGVPPDQPGLQAALLADVAALGEAAPGEAGRRRDHILSHARAPEKRAASSSAESQRERARARAESESTRP